MIIFVKFLLLLVLCAFGTAQPSEECGDCVITHQSPGCNVKKIQDAVCKQDDFCCEVQWDEMCVRIARVCENCLPATAGNCLPETLFIHRHAERFMSDEFPRDDGQEVLTQEGVNRAMALAAKYFTERLPLEALFVSNEYIRSPMTAVFLAAGTAVTSITRYPASDFDAVAQMISRMDPCPQQIDIVTHSFFIRGIFQALGFEFKNISTIIEFGQFFGLENDDKSTVNSMTYGLLESNGNQPWPGLMPFPYPKYRPLQEFLPLKNGTCEPEVFYVHNSAERYIAANGDGTDDSHETLTPEGIMRSFDLRDKFLNDQLPLEASFVAEEYIRSYLTAGPTIAGTAISYAKTYLAKDAKNKDLKTKIAQLDPCPAHVEIVTEPNFIEDVFEALGFDSSEIDNIEGFDQFFSLINEDRQVISDAFGVSCENSAGNLPWPGLIPFPSRRVKMVRGSVDEDQQMTMLGRQREDDALENVRSRIVTELNQRIK